MENFSYILGEPGWENSTAIRSLCLVNYGIWLNLLPVLETVKYPQSPVSKLNNICYLFWSISLPVS